MSTSNINLRAFAKAVFQFFALTADQPIGFDDNGQIKNIDGLGGSVTEDEFALSDVTTADASADAHGFMPKLDGDPTHVFRGDGSQAQLSVADVAGAAPTSPTVNAQTKTSYMLDLSDNGKELTLDNANPITVTVPSGLGAGFNCLCIQLGEGEVTFVTDGATVNHRRSHTKIAGQFGVASLVAYEADVLVLAGDTAA